MKILPLGLLATAGLLAATGCQSTKSAPLPTAAGVNFQRYAGRWYEVARLPTPFQKPDESAQVEYRLQADGKVRVVNTAMAPDGRIRTVRGSAESVPGSNNARLRVRFEGLAALVPVPEEGNYWIIERDPGYRFAMVGTPDRKFLWILARSPDLPPATLTRLIARAQELGFATENLIRANRG